MQIAEAPSSPPRDELRRRRLSDIYAPCFMLILQLRATDQFGDAEVLRRRVDDLLKRAEREASQARWSPEDVRLAQFAIVAFIDEAIFASGWPQKDAWLANPLTLQRFQRVDAGEQFFTELERLRARPETQAEVLEVYYLCMTLGFKGKYRILGQEQLRMLIEDTYAQLSRTPGMGVGALAPQGRPRDQIVVEIKRNLPIWVIVVAAVAIGLIVYLFLSLSITREAEEAARAIGQIPEMTL